MDSANARAAKPKELPHSDIRATAARVIDISKIESSPWSHGGEYVVHPSIVVEFTNQAAERGPQTEPTVSALLTYQDAKREILKIAGGWTDSPTPFARFNLHESHKLLLGFVQDGHFVAVEHAPADAPGARDDQMQKLHRLPGFLHGLVCVSLTDVHTHQLLYDSYFDIGIYPLRISHNLSHQD